MERFKAEAAGVWDHRVGDVVTLPEAQRSELFESLLVLHGRMSRDIEFSKADVRAYKKFTAYILGLAEKFGYKVVYSEWPFVDYSRRDDACEPIDGLIG